MNPPWHEWFDLTTLLSSLIHPLNYRMLTHVSSSCVIVVTFRLWYESSLARVVRSIEWTAGRQVRGIYAHTPYNPTPSFLNVALHLTLDLLITVNPAFLIKAAGCHFLPYLHDTYTAPSFNAFSSAC